MPEPTNKHERDTAYLGRIALARQDRDKHVDRINEFYGFVEPTRQKVGTTKRADQSNDDQGDIMDNTLQEEVLDFAAVQSDFFVPQYKEWVKAKLMTEFGSSTDAQQGIDALKAYEKRLYELIRGTDFYEMAQELFVDLAGGAMGISIPLVQSIKKPIRTYPVLMNALLMERGPSNDLDGRWFECEMQKQHITRIFGDKANYSEITRWQQAKPTDMFNVVQGNTRNWEKDGMNWVWTVVVDNKITLQTDSDSQPATVIATRWRVSPPSAWGPGPAEVAMPAARTLDELAYQHLRGLAYDTNPPLTYEHDGLQNFDEGIVPGGTYPRKKNTKPPTQFLRNQQGAGFFDKEELVKKVKRALHTDVPEQLGKTPPTTVQWLDEKAEKQRRQQSRMRIYREFVLPVLQRFAYVFAKRGQLPPVKIGEEVIEVEFVSPLSKASDAQEVTVAIQLAQTFVSVWGETALASMDAFATMENMKTKLDDNTLVIIKPDEQQELIKEALGQGRNIVDG